MDFKDMTRRFIPAAMALALATAWPSTPDHGLRQISRHEAGCLTDTDCKALADTRALIGLGCTAPTGMTPWWPRGAPLYRDDEDQFPATCHAIYPVMIGD